MRKLDNKIHPILQQLTSHTLIRTQTIRFVRLRPITIQSRFFYQNRLLFLFYHSRSLFLFSVSRALNRLPHFFFSDHIKWMKLKYESNGNSINLFIFSIFIFFCSILFPALPLLTNFI